MLVTFGRNTPERRVREWEGGAQRYREIQSSSEFFVCTI